MKRRCQYCKAFSNWNYCAWCGRGEKVRNIAQVLIIIGLLAVISLMVWCMWPWIQIFWLIFGGGL